MAFEKSVEALIREAMLRGDFDDLPGEGKPVDLRAYFESPEEVRVAQALLKGAGIQPLEVQLIQEISALKEALLAEENSVERKRITASINRKQLELNLLLERLQKTTK